jgi:hypothetical protein
MPERLAKLGPEQVASGINPSLPMDNDPFWIDGSGVVFREFSVQPGAGQFAILDKLEVAPVRGLLEAEVSGRKKLIFGTLKHLYVWDESLSLPVRRTNTTQYPSGYNGQLDSTATTRATLWSTATWGNYILATNGVDLLQYNDSTDLGSNFRNLDVDGRFTKAEIVLPLKQFILVFNTSVAENQIAWCALNQPEDWIPTNRNEAGSLLAKDIQGPILAARYFGEGIAFYTSSSMSVVSFIGDPFWFGERKFLSDVGVVGKGSVCSVGRLHYGLGPRGIWRTDGFQVQYIDEPAIREYVFSDINREQWDKSLVFHNVSEGLVEVHYPTKDSKFPNRCVAFSTREQLWTIKNYARTAGSSADVFRFPITGDNDGNVYMQSTEGESVSAVSSPLEMNASFEVLSLYGELGYGGGGYGGRLSGTG